MSQLVTEPAGGVTYSSFEGRKRELGNLRLDARQVFGVVLS